MRSTLIVEVGAIGEDGRLRLPMERVEQFCKEHAGERAIVRIEAVERHGSAAMFRYYFGYVVPTLRQGWAKTGELLTERQVHDRLWGMYPGEHNPSEDIRQAPRSQVEGYLEWLKEIAAEWLETYIDEPKIFIKR